MSRETKSWRVLCNGPQHVESGLAAQLDMLQSLLPISYTPELMPTIMAMLYRGWLGRCKQQGLIDQAESEALFTALRDADVKAFQETPEFTELMAEAAALAENQSTGGTPDSINLASARKDTP